MHNQSAFISLVLITALAAVVPAVSARIERLRIPIVIGEILAGIIIGKSGLRLVQPGPILEFLAEFGFVFLMFISGLEVDITSLRLWGVSEERRPFYCRHLFMALISFGFTLAAAFVFAWGLVSVGLVENPFIMTLILGTTSLGIVVPVLKEQELMPTPYGQLILTSAMVADFVTLLLLSVVFGILKTGLGLQLILFLLLMVTFAFLFRMGIVASKVPLVKRLVQELSTATAQIRVRGSMALMVAWAALAHALGSEVILGAFLAGLFVNIIVGPEEAVLREQLDTLGFGFFIPIFFIFVGSQFDLFVLLGSYKALILFPILILGVYLVKLAPALLYRLAFSWRESFAAGFLLSSRLSLIIAASALAFEFGIISDAVNADIILMAIITCTLSPLLFSRLAPQPREDLREGIIIVGINQLTELLCERLLKEGKKVVLLESDTEKADATYCRSITPIFGDPTDESFLEGVGAARAEAIVILLSDSSDNLRVCQVARERFGIPVVVARADDHTMMEKMIGLGVRVIQPALATAIALEAALRFPAAFDVLAEHGHDVEVGEATIRNVWFDRRPLRDIRFPGNALVMGIRRKGEVIVPHGDTTFRLGDVVMLVGSPEAIKQTNVFVSMGHRGISLKDSESH